MFYTYTQNNSGGRYTGPGLEVVVEADSPQEADRIALNHGLYFDGIGDCLGCCGPRWKSQLRWGEDGGEHEIPALSTWRVSTSEEIPTQLVIRKAVAQSPIALPPAPRRLAVEA